MEADPDIETVFAENDGKSASKIPQSETPQPGSEESQPPSQPRVSWSAKTRNATRTRGDHDVNVVNPGTFTSDDGDINKGVFGTIAHMFSKALRWRRLDSVTPETSHQGDSRFLDPGKSSTSRRDDSIAMQSMNESGASSAEAGRTSRYTNPAFVPRYSDSDDQPPAESSESTNKNYRAYDSGIYSVNSAGKPVPITIEESGPADDSSSDEDDTEVKQNSTIRLRPKAKADNSHSKLLCSSIWRKTFRPDSDFIYYWLMVVTVTTLYNAWVIPLRGSFPDIQNTWSRLWLGLDVICDVIYIVDVYVRFRTRFIRGGIYVRDSDELVRHHRKRWATLFDILSVLPTDILFVVTINPYLRMNKVIRLYRAYTLYRLVEMGTYLTTVWRTINLAHIVLLVAHYNACFYYLLSIVNGYGASLSNWAYPDPALFPAYTNASRQYTYSFYWSLQSLFWNKQSVLPENDWQFAYTIYVDLIGFALTAFIIGYVTSLIVSNQSKKHDLERAMTSTLKYMKQRHLPKDLRHRVERFYHHTWHNSDFDHLDEKHMLRHLPIAVKQEMYWHSNFKALRQIPELSHCDSSLLRELVTKIQRRTYLPGQCVYLSGDAGNEMFIVGEGLLQIVKESDGSISMLHPGDVFGEMNILNIQKGHRRSSDVISCGYSELFVLTSQDVNEALSKYPKVMYLVMQQARRNRSMMNAYSRGTRQTKQTNSSSNIQSVSNVHVSMRGSTYHPELGRDESPDSALPPSPGRRSGSDADMPREERLPSDALGMIMRPDIVDKLNIAYQENLNSLKRSLDGVWQREVACLQQRLADTETERDNKAREVIQLRQRVVSARSVKPSPKEQAGGAAKVSSEATEKKEIKEAFSSNPNLKTNVKTVAKGRRRTLLPSESGSGTSSDGDLRARNGTTRRPSAIQETPLDVYGSLTSLTSQP